MKPRQIFDPHKQTIPLVLFLPCESGGQVEVELARTTEVISFATKQERLFFTHRVVVIPCEFLSSCNIASGKEGKQWVRPAAVHFDHLEAWIAAARKEKRRQSSVEIRNCKEELPC